jgi:hypothetical protein
MEMQLALAGDRNDTEKFKAVLVAQGYEIRTKDKDTIQDGQIVVLPGDPDSKDLAAYKTFKDSAGVVRAELQMSLDDGGNVEYSGRARINIGEPDQKTAYWFSVHQHNVDDKLEVIDALMTKLYGQPNQ